MSETVYYRETHHRFFIAEMSNNRKIQIDPDEMNKISEAIRTGSVVRVRQGMFNPSFLVDVVEDETRIKEFFRQHGDVKKHNEQDRKYNSSKNQKTFKGMQQLKDIFSEIPSLAKVDRKKIGDGQ